MLTSKQKCRPVFKLNKVAKLVIQTYINIFDTISFLCEVHIELLINRLIGGQYNMQIPVFRLHRPYVYSRKSILDLKITFDTYNGSYFNYRSISV